MCFNNKIFVIQNSETINDMRAKVWIDVFWYIFSNSLPVPCPVGEIANYFKVSRLGLQRLCKRFWCGCRFLSSGWWFPCRGGCRRLENRLFFWNFFFRLYGVISSICAAGIPGPITKFLVL